MKVALARPAGGVMVICAELIVDLQRFVQILTIFVARCYCGVKRRDLCILGRNCFLFGRSNKKTFLIA